MSTPLKPPPPNCTERPFHCTGRFTWNWIGSAFGSTGAMRPTRRQCAGIAGVIPINHGNAWSLYFNDPEGNGLECFVDSPFHVAQPFADQLDLSTDDATIESATEARIATEPEFQPIGQWQAELKARAQYGQNDYTRMTP